MLYRTIRALIAKKKTEGLEEKIDVFYATGKLTDSEYRELVELLNAN